MKAALSIVLAGLLITLPITQVLAQAGQQDSTTTVASFVPEERPQPVLGYPALNYGAVLVWQPPVTVDPASILWEPSLSSGDAVTQIWNDWSTIKRVWVVVALVFLVTMAVVFFIYGEEVMGEGCTVRILCR